MYNIKNKKKILITLLFSTLFNKNLHSRTETTYHQPINNTIRQTKNIKTIGTQKNTPIKQNQKENPSLKNKINNQNQYQYKKEVTKQSSQQENKNYKETISNSINKDPQLKQVVEGLQQINDPKIYANQIDQISAIISQEENIPKNEVQNYLRQKYHPTKYKKTDDTLQAKTKNLAENGINTLGEVGGAIMGAESIKNIFAGEAKNKETHTTQPILNNEKINTLATENNLGIAKKTISESEGTLPKLATETKAVLPELESVAEAALPELETAAEALIML